MTADELTRRAIIAAHDAECPCAQWRGDDATTYPKLTTREQAIVALWRADRDEHSEQFGGLAECGGEGVDCDIHPVTLVDHEGPVSCVWCSLSAARDRAEKAEAAIERARAVHREHTNTALVEHCKCIACNMARALDGTEATS